MARHFTKYIWFSNSISLFLNENRLRKLLFNYISLDFAKNRIFLFKVVDPILIINDPLYVSFEAWAQYLAKTGALAADPSKTPQKDC